MALTHDGTILVVADGNRVGFFDIVRLISGRRHPALGYWTDGAKFAGRVYVTITSDDAYLFVSDEFVNTPMTRSYGAYSSPRSSAPAHGNAAHDRRYWRGLSVLYTHESRIWPPITVNP
jgi:hypothetical protein